MDVPSFMSLETSPAVKYLLLKKHQFHTNKIFAVSENYEQYHRMFYRLSEHDEDFFQLYENDTINFSLRIGKH